MLFRLLLSLTFIINVSPSSPTEVNTEKPKPIVFPVPLELPNRNDKANQCWLRIDDVEITETLAVYCTVAQAFLSYYIHDYNIRKMSEDAVDVSLWIEKPTGEKDHAYGPPRNVNGIIDWRMTTVMDPTTRRRLYVSKDAVCRLVMYSREGMTNYIVDCATLLYFVNEHNSSEVISSARLLLFTSIFLVYFIV